MYIVELSATNKHFTSIPSRVTAMTTEGGERKGRVSQLYACLKSLAHELSGPQRWNLSRFP